METTKQKLWTVDEYYRMADAGILDPEERTELVDGQIIIMAAKKPPHVITTELAADYLGGLLFGLAHVRLQDPVSLDSRSEPEPDIAVVVPPLRRYLDHHPTPAEIFLIIEVADATLKLDTKRKAKMYAQAGIEDYWVVDATAHRAYIFREPDGGRYNQEFVLGADDTIRPLAFLDVEVELRQFFP